MGGSVTVDPGRLKKVGAQLQDTASKLKAGIADVGQHHLKPESVTEVYKAPVARANTALSHLTGWLTSWKNATEKMGTTVTDAANMYEKADAALVTQIDAAGVNLDWQ